MPVIGPARFPSDWHALPMLPLQACLPSQNTPWHAPSYSNLVHEPSHSNLMATKSNLESSTKR